MSSQTISGQEWLTKNFPTLEERKRIKTIKIYSFYNSFNRNPQSLSDHETKLIGELDLNEFTDLEELFIIGQTNDNSKKQELTALQISNCVKLKTLYLNENAFLANLDLTTLSDLNVLDVSFCPQLTNLDLSHNLQLRHIVKDSNLKLYTALDQWRQEAQNLQNQLNQLQQLSAQEKAELAQRIVSQNNTLESLQRQFDAINNTPAQQRLASKEQELTQAQQEIQQLKEQIAALEADDTSSISSTTTSEDAQEVINRKKRELEELARTGRGSTAHLRKEIKLLENLQKAQEKAQRLQNDFNNLQTRTNQEKERLINRYQQEANQALENWNREKGQLQNILEQLEREKLELEQTIADLESQLTEKEEELSQIKEERQELLDNLQQQKDWLGGNNDRDYIEKLINDQAEYQRICQQLKNQVSEEQLKNFQEQIKLIKAKDRRIKELDTEKAELEQKLLDVKIKLTPKTWSLLQAQKTLPDERTWWEKHQNAVYFI